MVAMRDFIEALTAELRRAGITDYEVEHGGKHPRIVYQHDGRRKLAPFPCTPSDPAGLLNNVAQLRRSLGLSAPERGKSNRPKKRRAGEVDKPPILTTFAALDPFAVLAQWKPPPATRFLWTRIGSRSWRVEIERNALAPS